MGSAQDKGETWSGLGECLEDVALPAVAGISTAIDAAKARGEIGQARRLFLISL